MLGLEGLEGINPMVTPAQSSFSISFSQFIGYVDRDKYAILRDNCVINLLKYFITPSKYLRESLRLTVRKCVGNDMYDVVKGINYRVIKKIMITPSYVIITYKSYYGEIREWGAPWNRYHYTIIMGKDENGRLVIFRPNVVIHGCGDIIKFCSVVDTFRVNSVVIDVIDSDSWLYEPLNYDMDVKDVDKPVLLMGRMRVRAQGDIILYCEREFSDINEFKYAYFVEGGLPSIDVNVVNWFIDRISEKLDGIGITYTRGVRVISIPIPYYYIHRYALKIVDNVLGLASSVDQSVVYDSFGVRIGNGDIAVELDRINGGVRLRIRGVDHENPEKLRSYVLGMGLLDRIPFDIYRFNIGRHVIEYYGLPRFIEFSVDKPFDMIITVDYRNSNVIYVSDWIKITHPEHGRVEVEVAKPCRVEIHHVSRLPNDLLIRNAKILLSL
jgi:hypothetical protein